MELEKVVRDLAKSNKFQTLYMLVKEGGLQIFNNKSDYTDLQILFLNYLNFYNNIYTEIALDEVSEAVLEDDIYADAYIYYKRITKLKEKKKDNIPQQSKSTVPIQKNNKTSWVFKSRKKVK